MNWHQLPNLLSVLRIVLVPPVVFYILRNNYMPALILFVIAGATDSLDGWLAKHFGWESALGEILDPLADKLLLVSSYICFAWLELLPVWLVIIVILRDITIIVGGVAYRFFYGMVVIKPSYISKLNTLMQIVLIAVMLFSLALLAVDTLLIDILIWVVLFTTLASGISYIFDWGRRALYAAKR